MPSREFKSTWHFRPASSLVFIAVLFSPGQALCEEQPPPLPLPQPGVPQTPVSDTFDDMQAPRDYLSEKVTRYANNIDRFFGGDRHYQESNASRLHMRLSRATGYGGDRKLDFSVNLDLKLPVTEGRMRLLFETDPEKNAMDTSTKGTAAFPNKTVAPKSAAMALRYSSSDDGAWYFRTDGGLKFPLPIKPFVRAMGGYSTSAGEWQLAATESVYWFNTLGVGETTQLNLERKINEQFLFRSTSFSTWLNDKQNFDLGQSLSVLHAVDDRTALLYQVSAVGVSRPQHQVNDYVLLTHYRYRLHQKWLFFEISPQIHFPKELKYQSSFALSMLLEVLFDDSR